MPSSPFAVSKDGKLSSRFGCARASGRNGLPLLFPATRARAYRGTSMITNSQSRTNIQEIADGIYRINTPVSIPGGPGHFSFNQYLIVDDEPLLFHTGQRQLFR